MKIKLYKHSYSWGNRFSWYLSVDEIVVDPFHFLYYFDEARMLLSHYVH